LDPAISRQPPRDPPDRREAEEPPLDPAAERVRRKLARLLLGSLGVMVLGLVAVFAAILYRLSEVGDRADPAAARSGDAPVIAEVALPAGGTIASVSLEGGAILIHVALPGGGTQLLVVDAASGRVLTRLDVRPDSGIAAE
jgi:hypothetical protein